MAQYRCSIKPNLTRSAGQSAVSKAAYITRGRLHDARLDQHFDYSRHPSAARFVGVFAPQTAPGWARDAGQLANAIEAMEKRKDAQLARVIELNLPHEMSLEQQRRQLQDFIRANFTRKGYAVIAAIHEPDGDDDRNVHAHLLVTLRTIDENGFAKSKAQEQDNFRNRSQYAAALRASWAALGARHLERAGFPLEAERWRHGDKTLAAQRDLALARGDHEHAAACDHEPGRHLGPAAAAMERSRRATERGDLNRDVESRNGLRAEIAALEKQQRRLDRHLGRLEALELEQMQRDNARDPEHAPRGTTQYAIDQLQDIAATQAASSADAPQQEADRRRAIEEAYAKMIEEQQRDQARRQEHRQRR